MLKPFLFSLVFFLPSAQAEMIQFSKNTEVKASEVNANLEYLQREIESAIHSFNFTPFISGQVISESSLNNEFSKLTQLGFSFTPFTNKEQITEESFNSRFQELKNQIPNLPSGIKIENNIRRYFDNTLASSCFEYKNRLDRRWKYSGSTGSGLYQVKFGDDVEQTVYCDMDTDGGGWTLVMYQFNTTMALHTTSAVSLGNLHLKNANAKMIDSRIKELAQNRESYIVNGNNRAIYRYSQAQWNSYSSVGWTNAMHDSKNAQGNWVVNACNGHYNNRGFSTWNDLRDSGCLPVYSGIAFYFTNYHTNSWGSSVSTKSGTSVFVR